jgi:hypothetical protein
MPPAIKVYEALGAVVDGRVEVLENKGLVFSSTRNKQYEVIFDLKAKKINSNDNGSFWHGYLGYPAIACLMRIGVVSYSEELALLLQNIPWKDLNERFDNDYNKTIKLIFSDLSSGQQMRLVEFAKIVHQQLFRLQLETFESSVNPPIEY